MFDWKIILAVIAVLLLLTGGLLKDLGEGFQGEDVKEFLNEIKDRLSNVIDISDFRVPVERNLNVSGVIQNKNSFDFRSSGANVLLKYRPELMNVTIDNKDMRIERRSAEIILKKFQGKAEMLPQEVDLGGNTESFSSQSFNLEGDNIPISAEGKYQEIGFGGIGVDRLKIKEGGGQLDIGKSVTVKVGEKPITLYGFLGNLTFTEDNLIVQGKISKATSGTQKIAVSMV